MAKVVQSRKATGGYMPSHPTHIVMEFLYQRITLLYSLFLLFIERIKWSYFSSSCSLA